VNTWATIATAILGGGGFATLIGYVKDRRFSRAKGAIAEGTISIRIDEDRLSLLRQTQDAERDVWKATNAHLQAELAQERLDSAKKDERIAELVRLVEELRADSDALQNKLAVVEAKLAQFTEEGS
jgi:hypothetical protein